MNAPVKRPPVRRVFRLFARLGVLCVLVVAVLLVSLWLEHRTETTLPIPTGPFTVGRAIYDWIDDSNLDTLAPAQGTKRELLVWMWYPAENGRTRATIDDYVPLQVRAADSRAGVPLLFKLLTRELSKVHGHSVRDADVSPQQQSYPVVIMRAGASAEVWNYSTLAEDLASHGYIVVGFDAPYRTHLVAFPDGRVVTRLSANNPEICLEMTGQERDRCADKLLSAWTFDMAFVLGRLAQWNISDPSGKFTGRLDMTRVGVFGHSFGGAAALKFCREDPRCKTGIDIDGAPHGNVVQSGINRPFMILLSDHSRESDPESRQIMASLQAIFDRLPPDGRAFIEIRGANHFLFSDDGALRKSHIILRILRMFGIVGIEGRRQLEITTYCLRTFFNTYLKGPSGSGSTISSPLYPEIQVLK